jgi:hypothetical protein
MVSHRPFFVPPFSGVRAFWRLGTAITDRYEVRRTERCFVKWTDQLEKQGGQIKVSVARTGRFIIQYNRLCKRKRDPLRPDVNVRTQCSRSGRVPPSSRRVTDAHGRFHLFAGQGLRGTSARPRENVRLTLQRVVES